jgi:hypothetical protein
MREAPPKYCAFRSNPVDPSNNVKKASQTLTSEISASSTRGPSSLVWSGPHTAASDHSNVEKIQPAPDGGVPVWIRPRPGQRGTDAAELLGRLLSHSDLRSSNTCSSRRSPQHDPAYGVDYIVKGKNNDPRPLSQRGRAQKSARSAYSTSSAAMPSSSTRLRRPARSPR